MEGMVIVVLFFLVIIAYGIKKWADNLPDPEQQEPVQEEPSAQEHALRDDTPHQYLTFKVVGVTFKNGRRSRQTILRQIRFQDPPYDAEPEIRIERYEYEGEPAFSVWANEEQVGNIGRDDIPQLLSLWDSYDSVTDFSVYGGGEGRSYGMQITVRFKKENDAVPPAASGASGGPEQDSKAGGYIMREDIQRALEKYEIEIPPFGGKKDLARAEELLHSDETVLFAAPTNISITHANTKKTDKAPGTAFLTTKRFLCSYKVLSNFSIESVPLEEIQSVDCSGGPYGKCICVHTLTKSFSVVISYKIGYSMEDAQKILHCFEEAIANTPPSPADAPAPSVSAADEILKYKNLLDCGAITEEEFAAKKKQLLNL